MSFSSYNRANQKERNKNYGTHNFDLQAFSEPECCKQRNEKCEVWSMKTVRGCFTSSKRCTTRSARILLSIFFFVVEKRRMKTPTFSYSPVCDAVVWCCALVSVCVLVKSASRKLTQCARTIFHIKCSLFILFSVFFAVLASRFVSRSSYLTNRMGVE